MTKSWMTMLKKWYVASSFAHVLIIVPKKRMRASNKYVAVPKKVAQPQKQPISFQRQSKQEDIEVDPELLSHFNLPSSFGSKQKQLDTRNLIEKTKRDLPGSLLSLCSHSHAHES